MSPERQTVPFRLLLATAIVALAPTAIAGDEPSRVIATWAGGDVTAERYASWLAFRGAQEDPTRLRDEIEAMLLVTTLAEQALRNGLDTTPEARRIFDVFELKTREQARKRQRLEAIRVSEEAIDTKLKENPRLLQKPEKVRLRTLFKRFPADAGDDARAAVQHAVAELRDRVLAGADFAELAGAESDSQTRFRGGLMGNVARGQLPEGIETIVFALQPGEVSELVPTSGGYSLFYCDRRLPPESRPLAEARERVRSGLRSVEAKNDWERYVDSLLDQSGLRFPDEAPTQPEDVVAYYRDGQVSLAEVEIWRGVAGLKFSADPPISALQTAARQIVQTRLAAERSSLDSHPDLRQRLDWRKASWLATNETTRRLRDIVEPPTETDVRGYFEANRERFSQEDRFDLSVIYVAVTREDLPRRYREMLALREALHRGDLDFAAAAAAHSEHPSAADGGRLETLARSSMAGLGPNVFKTVVNLAPGEVGELAQQDLTLWIVKLHGKQPQRLLEYDVAREAAERRLGNRLVREARATLESELRTALAVELVQ